MPGITRRVVMSPIPMTIQFSMCFWMLLQNKGPAGLPALDINMKSKLLLGRDCVLRGFGDAELHDRLCLDLDRFAGLRIASDAGFAMRLHQAAQSGNNENPVLLCFFDGGVGEVFEERRRGFVGKLSLLGQLPNELCFGQTCSHKNLLRKIGLIPSGLYLIPAGLWKTAILRAFLNPHAWRSASLQGISWPAMPERACHAYQRGNDPRFCFTTGTQNYGRTDFVLSILRGSVSAW